MRTILVVTVNLAPLAMAFNDCVASPVRLGREDCDLLQTYLEAGDIDFARLSRSSYVDDLLDRENFWRRHRITTQKNKNARQNFCRYCCDWRAA